MSEEPPLPPLIGGQIWLPELMPSSRSTRILAISSLGLNAIECPLIVEALVHLVDGLRDHHPVTRVIILLTLPLIAMLLASIAYQHIRKEKQNSTNAFLASLASVVSIIWILVVLAIWVCSYYLPGMP